MKLPGQLPARCDGQSKMFTAGGFTPSGLFAPRPALPGGGSEYLYEDYKALLDRYVPHYATKVAAHGARPH